jgi:hypothetical protein
MRSYIFTERERRILQAFVDGKTVDNIEVSKILFRFREYKVLPVDIDLYFKVRSIAESKIARST